MEKERILLEKTDEHKSPEITLESESSFKIVLKSINIKESILITKMGEKAGTFKQISNILERISNIDGRALNTIWLVEAIELLLYYRYYFWENTPLADGIDPIDLFHSSREKEEKTIEINNHRYTNRITLKSAIDAETLCMTMNHRHILNIYIMGAGCIKSIKQGVDSILELPDNEENKNVIDDYNYIISQTGGVSINLLPLNAENNKEYGKLSLLSKSEGLGSSLFFRESALLEFGL